MGRFHDLHGHPYATLPMDDFIGAWRADSIGYATEPFTARGGFQRIRDVDAATSPRRALPVAARWLAGDAGLPVPAGSLGGEAGVERLAELIEAGLELAARPSWLLRDPRRRPPPSRRSHLPRLHRENKAAGIADAQARLVGALQHPLVTDQRTTVARLLRRLAPNCEQLRASLPGGDRSGPRRCGGGGSR